MTKGGPRIGAGRPPKPDSRRSKANARKAEREKLEAAAEVLRGHTAPDGKKVATAPAGWPFGTQDPPPEPTLGPDVPTDASPLDVLEQFMRDGSVDIKLRAQCATWAAPYRHAKKGEKAEKPASPEAPSKFGGIAPPRLVKG